MKTSFCFVGGGARTLMGHSEGGSERQIALLSAELARRGRLVRLVSTSCQDEAVIRGVHVLSGWPSESSLPLGLRMWAERLPSLRRLLVSLEPDILYTRGFSVFAPSVAAASRRSGAAYLAALASDDDLRVFPRSRPKGILRAAGYGPAARAAFVRFALGKACLVLAQHGGQMEACFRRGFPARLVRNAFLPPPSIPRSEDRFDVAWIGHLSAFKGFDRLLEVLPGIRGMRIAIAGAMQEDWCRQLLERALRFPGVAYLGELSHESTMELIASSKVLLNTSPAEGFSNAFLEAWFLERPVASLIANPDSLLTGAESPGFCASGDAKALAAFLADVVADPEKRLVMGARGRDLVERNHMLGPVVDSLERAAEDAVG